MSENIKNTGFIQEIRPPAYEFINNKAFIYTYYKPQSKNSINGLVGIQPGENETVQFTGNVALNFQNALSFGEELKINWRRMFNSSQNLIAELSYPFIFNTNFEIQGGIDMIKKDSSFFNFNSKLIINYKSNSNFSNGFLFTNNNSTNLLEDDYSSTSVNSFGFVTNFKKLDNPLNPRRGFKIKSELAYGWKETYTIDTVANNILKSPNFNGNLSFSSYLRLFKRTTLKIKLSGSTIQNNILYENELTRMGGYKTIRGFDEESLWVSSFVLGNFELRYLIDEKSNVFLFSDFAWTESKTKNFLKEDYFQSFGFGTNISMPNGLLTLIYGLGRKIDNPFLIRTGKIHLGFTSYF
jgi:hemolysin activation/secretion protein